jgi:hypothetical protein
MGIEILLLFLMFAILIDILKFASIPFFYYQKKIA